MVLGGMFHDVDESRIVFSTPFYSLRLSLPIQKGLEHVTWLSVQVGGREIGSDPEVGCPACNAVPSFRPAMPTLNFGFTAEIPGIRRSSTTQIPPLTPYPVRSLSG